MKSPGRLFLCALGVMLLSAPFFFLGRGYGLGFYAGFGASLVSFYLLSLSIPKGGGSAPSKAGAVILLGMRMVIAFVILAVSMRAGAHPLTMAAGITCALAVLVFMVMGTLPGRVLSAKK